MISTTEEEPTSPTSVRLKTPPTVEMIDHSAAEEEKKVDNDLSETTTESTIEKKSEPETEETKEQNEEVKVETIEEKNESKEVEEESKANETATISTYENPLLIDVRTWIFCQF